MLFVPVPQPRSSAFSGNSASDPSTTATSWGGGTPESHGLNPTRYAARKKKLTPTHSNLNWLWSLAIPARRERSAAPAQRIGAGCDRGEALDDVRELARCSAVALLTAWVISQRDDFKSMRRRSHVGSSAGPTIARLS